MRILVFEIHAAGHRLQFVRMVVEAIADLPVEITLATGSTTPAAPEFRTHLAPVLDRVTVDASFAVGDTSRPRRSALASVPEFGKAIRRHRPDHAYVPYADGLAQIAALPRFRPRPERARGLEIEGIIMRGRFAYPRASWREALYARAWLTATSRSPFSLLHFLDPIPYQTIVARGGRLAARTRLIPEPVELLRPADRIDARRRLDLPLAGRVLSCPGWLDERKGVDRLIRAFAAAAATPALHGDDRLLLVGHVHSPVRAALEDARELVERGRIIVRDGVVSDEVFHLAMSAADVVCAPYPRHIGSSGIVVRAAGLQRMILGSDFGWVGMVIRRFELGMTCDCQDDAAIARAIPAALDAAATFHYSEAARRFCEFHTQANFAAHIGRRLRERLGRPVAPQLRTWSWVLQAGCPQAGAARTPG